MLLELDREQIRVVADGQAAQQRGLAAGARAQIQPVLVLGEDQIVGAEGEGEGRELAALVLDRDPALLDRVHAAGVAGGPGGREDAQPSLARTVIDQLVEVGEAGRITSDTAGAAFWAASSSSISSRERP